LIEPLSLIYWSRAGLGIGAALLCTMLNILLNGLNLFSNISVALIVYIVAYYIYKWRFFAQVEKPSKIATHGIGAYFMTWILVLGLFFTILQPAAVFTYSPQFPVTDNTVTFNASNSYSSTGYIVSYKWDFGDGGDITTITSPTITHVYVNPGNYTLNLVVVNNYGFSNAISEIVVVRAPE